MKSYSIRSVLILTLIVAVLLAIPVRRAVNQKRGREWVAGLRGHVFFEHELRDDATTSPLFVGSKFFSRVLGVDLFDPVRCVLFDCDELVDLQPITKMPTLHTVVINIEMADDLDFSPLGELPVLQEVHFTEWSFVSDEQLAELRKRLPHVVITSDSHGTGS